MPGDFPSSRGEGREDSSLLLSIEDDDANVLKDDSELAFVQHEKGGKHRWGSTTMDPPTQEDLFPNTLLEVQAKTVVLPRVLLVVPIPIPHSHNHSQHITHAQGRVNRGDATSQAILKSVGKKSQKQQVWRMGPTSYRYWLRH